MIVSTVDDLPIGATVCGANRQDARFTPEALASVVVELPVDARVLIERQPPPPRDKKGRLGKKQRRLAKARLMAAAGGIDFRSLPYLRADGNFAKDPARADAKDAGYRLWAPNPGQSRRGLGVIRASVERAHAFLNQFGRICRRLDRIDRRYLGWAELAACSILMRRGFSP